MPVLPEYPPHDGEAPIGVKREGAHSLRLSKYWCGSGQLSYGAEVQAFKNWALMHPEQWAREAPVGVGIALRDTWRCN
jgi:hypothetical protein